MIDTTTNENQGASPMRPRRGRGRIALLIGVPALLLGAGVAARAYAWGPHHGGGDMSAEEVHEMMQRRLDRVLDRIKATPDQKTRVKAAVSRLGPEMEALHAEKRKLHEASRTALAAERVDAARVEQLRQEAVKLAERGSRAISSTVLEVAQVLTPEQRRQVLEHVGRHRHAR